MIGRWTTVAALAPGELFRNTLAGKIHNQATRMGCATTLRPISVDHAGKLAGRAKDD